MKIVGAVNNHWLAIKNARLEPQPFWGYEDIGAFLLLALFLGLILRLLVRLQFLSRSAMANPSIGLQSLVIALLGAGLYFILRLRYRQPVLKPLGLGDPSNALHRHCSHAGVIFCSWHCTIYAASEPGHAAHSNQRTGNPGASCLDPFLRSRCSEGAYSRFWPRARGAYLP